MAYSLHCMLLSSLLCMVLFMYFTDLLLHSHNRILKVVQYYAKTISLCQLHLHCTHVVLYRVANS